MQAPLHDNSSDYNAPAPSPQVSVRTCAVIACVGFALAAACLPLDPHAAALASKLQPGNAWALGGDLKRELEFVQQFGAVTSCVIAWVAILLLDPVRRVRLAPFLAASLATVLTVNALKMLLGRPRPKLGAPFELTPPWDTHQIVDGATSVARHAWETSQLWSFPSSHTSAAAVLAVFLAQMYPRLRPLAIGLACTVAAARVILFAHYPSDVVAGATIGLVVGLVAYDRNWAGGLIPASWRPRDPSRPPT